MPALKHVHTFERFRKNPESKHYGGTYRCIHPGCTSFFKHDLLSGKKAKCKCGAEFTIEPKIHFHLTSLKCAKCSGDKRQKKHLAAEQFAESVINLPYTTISADTFPVPEMEIVLEEPKVEPTPEQPDLFEVEEEQQELFEVERT